jgi:hypothetical protein
MCLFRKNPKIIPIGENIAHYSMGVPLSEERFIQKLNPDNHLSLRTEQSYCHMYKLIKKSGMEIIEIP